MKKLLRIGLAVLLILGLSGIAMAGTSDTQDVEIVVSSINEIATTGGMVTLTIDAAASGFTVGVSPITDVDSSTATYAITTNSSAGMKITASLDSDISVTGMKLYLTLGGTGATAKKDITGAFSSPEIVATGITNTVETGQTITLEVEVTADTPLATTSRTITLTLATV